MSEKLKNWLKLEEKEEKETPKEVKKPETRYKEKQTGAELGKLSSNWNQDLVQN